MTRQLESMIKRLQTTTKGAPEQYKMAPINLLAQTAGTEVVVKERRKNDWTEKLRDVAANPATAAAIAAGAIGWNSLNDTKPMLKKLYGDEAPSESAVAIGHYNGGPSFTAGAPCGARLVN